MTTLDLGGVVGRVALDDTAFQRVWTKVMGQMRQFGAEATKAAGGTAQLDEAMDATGKAGTTAAAGLDRATAASTRSTAAQRKAAATAKALSDAQARLGELTASMASASTKEQQALLRQAAAQERASLAAGQGSAQYARLASAQASVIAANRAVIKSQGDAGAAMIATGKKANKYLTLPLIAAAAVSVDQAAKFQKSLNTVAVATDQTAKSTEQGGKGLQRIAIETGQSLDQLTSALYTAEKSGEPVGKALGIVEASAKGAAAEGADLGVATQALTSIMASYGKSLDNPVKAENALIRGAGLAKTTYQDFANSLANVVPIASSLGISFAEVAGAEDTMTQHGETAQRAGENLGNLITNLAGQNNVASKALQQLGVDTIDLSKNLGKRGLTGSLDLVLEAINKHGKDGEIITSAFKQAAVATASLDTEIEKLPKSMRANAKAFVAGTMSYKDFYSYAKSLGGQQYAMAKDLITTQRAAQGFNSQLTSGNSTVKTLAATLKTALGGVTGMRTALMLSGTSAKTFKGDVDAIAKAAHGADGDILGWAQTQDTLDNKMKRAKESLQVLAVEIGDEVMPAVETGARGIGKFVSGIDHLSHTDKEILGWSAVTLAAIGPVMSIGGRLSRASAGLATFAGASTETAATVARNTQRIGAALAGIGLVYGSTQTGGTAGHLMGVFGGAATGAAIGSFFSPVGTAVGAVAGAVAGLGLSFLHSGDDAQEAADKQAAAARRAKEAVAEQRQAVDNLTASIMADNDAIGQNTRLQVENDLEKSGAFKLAGQLGISTKTLTDAVLGRAKAQRQLAAATAKIATTPGLLGTGDTAALDKLNSLLSKEGVNLHKAALTADEYAEANGKLKLATRSVAAQFALYGSNLDAATQVGQANLRFIDAHIARLVTERSAGKLTATGLDQQVSALRKQMTAYGYSTVQVDAFTRALRNVPKRVLTRIEKNGVTPGEIQALINKYGELPKSKQTDVGMKDRATPALTDLGSLLQDVTGQPYTAKVDADTSSARSSIEGLVAWAGSQLAALSGKAAGVGSGGGIGSLLDPRGKPKKHAAGGTVGGFGNADSELILATPGEEIIRKPQAEKHRALLKAINAGLDGFASGGTVGHISLGHASHQYAPGFLVSQALAGAVAPSPSTVGGWQKWLTVAEKAAVAERAQYDAAKANLQQLNAHAHALDRDAKKLADQASAMKSSTKAERAAKDAAEDHAKAAQKVADAADKMASRAQKAYDKIKSASQAATEKAKQDAQSLVAAVQSEFDALQQEIQTFQSGIGQGLTAGSDLATIWGNLTSNVDSAKQALDAAQSALDQATPDTSKLAAAQQAQAQATAAQAAAHAALTQALAGGDAAAILAAQQAQTTAAANLADAQAAVTAATPTADQLAAQAAAQQDLTAAQQAYNAAVQQASAGGVADVLAQFQASEAQFATDLSKLQASGAGQDLISQLAGLGATAGDALAQGLINDPKALASIESSMNAINSIAQTEGDSLASGFYGAGVKSMEQLLAGIEKKWPAVKAALAPILAQLGSLFSGGGGTYTVKKGDTLASILNAEYGTSKSHPQLAAFLAANPELQGVSHTGSLNKFAGTSLTVPAFATGVTDFAGGLAMVHRDELLVNLPKGTDVIPANRAKDAFGSTDLTPLTSRLDRIETRLADAPERTGVAVGAATVGVIDRHGRAHADQVRRAYRKGAQ